MFKKYTYQLVEQGALLLNKKTGLCGAKRRGSLFNKKTRLLDQQEGSVVFSMFNQKTFLQFKNLQILCIPAHRFYIHGNICRNLLLTAVKFNYFLTK